MKNLLTWTERRLLRLFRKLSNRQNVHLLKAEMFEILRLPRTEKGASKIEFLFQVSGHWYRPDTGQQTVPEVFLELGRNFRCWLKAEAARKNFSLLAFGFSDLTETGNRASNLKGSWKALAPLLPLALVFRPRPPSFIQYGGYHGQAGTRSFAFKTGLLS